MALVGMEIPIIGSDSVRWVEIAVPSYALTRDSPVVVPVTENTASCRVIGNPPSYLIWKIRKSSPFALDILELSTHKEFPTIGLRIIFPEALSPFVHICTDEISSSLDYPYMLYALSVSGVAYLFRLKNISAYASCSSFASNELTHFEIPRSLECGPVTAAAAMAGCFVVGRDDGSVACFRLGSLDQNAPGFMHEFKEDAIFSRLFGIMSRGGTAGPVKDLVILVLCGRKLLFVLHADGMLRVWDILGNNKIFSQSLHISGNTSERLWVDEGNHDEEFITLGVLHKQSLEASKEGIYVHNLIYKQGDRLSLSLDSSVHYIPLFEAQLIDVKLSSQKIWVLKEDGLLVQDLLHPDSETGTQCYSLQEAFVGEELLLNSERLFDELLQITCSIFASAKAKISAFVSSIILHRLFHPGVYNTIVLRALLEDYNKQWTDAEFKVLTVDGLKREILSLMEHEAITSHLFSIFKCWRDFCSRYYQRWCKGNTPYGLLVDPQTEALGVIRENSTSLFRCLEDIELLVQGSLYQMDDPLNIGLDISGDAIEKDILFEVLRCQNNLSQGFGGTISAVFYESFLSEPTMLSDDIVDNLLKILESGPSSSVMAVHASQLGTDLAWQKELQQHKRLRNFSVDMLVSLHSLRNNARGWARVLDAVESYLKYLIPQKAVQNMDSEMKYHIKTSIIVQATSQVSKVMFESALGLLLFLKYLLSVGGQLDMSNDDMSKVQLELIPMVYEIIMEWLIICFLATMPSESPIINDFSSQLSSLCIDGDPGKESWMEKLGSVNFVLAFVVLMNCHGIGESPSDQSSHSLSSPGNCTSLVQKFTMWIVWGGSGHKSEIFEHSMKLALIFLRHGQYKAVETLLMIVGGHLSKEKSSQSIQSPDGEWCLLHHLLGCCLIAQAQGGLHGPSREKKLGEAVRCFFRASFGEGAAHALQNVPCDAGLAHVAFVTASCGSAAEWRLHYYQWAMQAFEQYNFSDAACQFALAALEQVDEAVSSNSDGSGLYLGNESAITIKGRMWANIFKFTLDLYKYNDAYCAIVSNPDEESQQICLRRFIIVLYERGAAKMLCNGQLPFISLTEKAERELAWKAARSDISIKPNPYRLLYALEIHQQNWRKAARYIYLYAVRLKNESSPQNQQNLSYVLQERINSISAAINALHLVDPAYAWIDLQGGSHFHNELNPSKKARTEAEQSYINNDQMQTNHTFIDIQKLEDEFVLTSAEYLLASANVKWACNGSEKMPSGLVDVLVDSELYDMAFMVLLRFWKGSTLQRELERVFSSISLKCCPNVNSIVLGSHGRLLTMSNDDTIVNEEFDADILSKQSKRSSHWEVLELYLEKYKIFHSRLPVVVAEVLLRSDPQIELPLWLVRMFKGERKPHSWGMTGQESDPASLFRLYVNYGRFADATDLLIEYTEEYASVKPSDIIRRKRPFSAWFPYTAVELLCCQLDESICLNHMVEQCTKLKTRLHGALRSHLILVKGDSEDALSSMFG